MGKIGERKVVGVVEIRPGAEIIRFCAPGIKPERAPLSQLGHICRAIIGEWIRIGIVPELGGQGIVGFKQRQIGAISGGIQGIIVQTQKLQVCK